VLLLEPLAAGALALRTLLPREGDPLVERPARRGAELLPVLVLLREPRVRAVLAPALLRLRRRVHLVLLGPLPTPSIVHAVAEKDAGRRHWREGCAPAKIRG